MWTVDRSFIKLTLLNILFLGENIVTLSKIHNRNQRKEMKRKNLPLQNLQRPRGDPYQGLHSGLFLFPVDVDVSSRLFRLHEFGTYHFTSFPITLCTLWVRELSGKRLDCTRSPSVWLVYADRQRCVCNTSSTTMFQSN